MANETNFFSKKILIWKEATKGVTPVTINKAYALTVLAFGLNETQKTEKNNQLGNGGQASSTDVGTSDYAGSLDCKYTGGLMPVLLTHTIGKSTKTNASSGAWAGTTVYALGDIVSHSNGTNDLICTVAGTSGSTEPDLTGLSNDDTTAIDGSVYWVMRPIMFNYVGSSDQCLETLGLESQVQTGCELTPVTFKERYTGIFINSLELSKQSGVIIYKYALPVVTMGRVDSQQAGFTDLTITNEETIADSSFGYDDLSITIGGSAPVNSPSFMLTINRNTSLTDGVKVGEKIDNTPIMEINGEMKLKFTIEEYTNAYNNLSKEVVMSFSKANGDAFTLTFPAVEFLRSPLMYSTDEPIYLTIPLNAKGTSSVKTVSYTCISATDW